ncbi:exonuclease VII small subunit domain-containing protein [Fusarium pseudocircinatum]|uniref:Exonuclease VII small subunit domain-containing protein n=1 Tax=Fusarium pseudocircinatum TaxID=56676 RepID=A0A8H5KHT5_9HYPO|nr:exonuclease VII small subunit domain-containing protein [Fusarium pseudocircinatum]
MVIELHIAAEQESGTTALESWKADLDKWLAETERGSAEKSSKRSDEDAQTLPAITATALPIALASAYSLGAAAGGVLGQARAPGALQPNSLAQQPRGSSAANGGQPVANDPASAAAYQFAYLFTAFFAFLGGDDKDMDWTKFDMPEANAESEDPSANRSGIIWLLRQLQGELADVPRMVIEAAKKLAAAFNRAISVANEIKQHIEKGTSLKSERASAEVVNKWKAAVKGAKNDVLSLSAASGSTASVNSPNPFTKTNIEVPKSDLSTQTAQLNGAMQGVQIAQNDVDAAEANYDRAIKKQEEAAAAMLAVELKLKTLNDKAKLLENVKIILSECITVLVDLPIQISKLEKLSSLLSSLIETIILKKTDLFAEEMGVVAETEITCQTIYTATLQPELFHAIRYYIHNEDEIMAGLKDRARAAIESSKAIEAMLTMKGFAIDTSAKLAIEGGAQGAKEDAKDVLATVPSLTVTSRKVRLDME